MPLEESVENPEKKQKKWAVSQTREFSGTAALKMSKSWPGIFRPLAFAKRYSHRTLP